MEPYAQDFNAIIEGYEENMVVGFNSEGTIWGEEVGEYKSIAGNAARFRCVSLHRRGYNRPALLYC